LNRPPPAGVRLAAPFRVALVSLVFSLIISMPVLLFVYHQTDRLFEQGIRDRIDDREQDLTLGYSNAGVPGLVDAIDQQMSTGVARGGAILLVDPAGRKLAGNIAAWPPILRAPTDWTEMRLYPEGQARTELFALRAVALPSGHRLLLGSSIEDRERMRASLIEALLGALLLAIPLGLIGGWFVLKVTERRARAIGNVAARIAAGDFSHRLDERAEDAEFAMLAAAINAMLERIEELVEQLRLVTDSLAHDLRSPLTRMRANIERALGGSGAKPQEQAMEAVSADIDGMLRLISATLEISRTEAGAGRQDFASFDVVALLRDISEIYAPLGEERGIAIRVHETEGITYFGNRQSIGQAVANLVDNALKYGSGDIELGAVRRGDFVDLWVSDRGAGIPLELRGDAVRKYRRLDESRTTEGSGLGLALARAVARLHGGDIRLEDNGPGLRAVVTLKYDADEVAVL
jgi:signal transduction histidine kinase